MWQARGIALCLCVRGDGGGCGVEAGARFQLGVGAGVVRRGEARRGEAGRGECVVHDVVHVCICVLDGRTRCAALDSGRAPPRARCGW